MKLTTILHCFDNFVKLKQLTSEDTLAIPCLPLLSPPSESCSYMHITYCTGHTHLSKYRIAGKFGGGKFWRIG